MAPGFLGLFSKRDKSTTPRKNAAEDAARRPLPGGPTSSAKSSTAPSVDASEQFNGSELSVDAEYVLADAESPALPNSIYHLGSPSSSASSTKLKMPFRRRKPSIFSASSSKLELDDSPPPLPPPKPSFLTSRASSDSSLHPPSRSAIFSSYGDPHSALSTRSLPQDQSPSLLPRSSQDTARRFETMSNPDPHNTGHSPPPPTPPKKLSNGSRGLFAWARARERTKSRPTAPASVPQPNEVDAASFNLKSFRHVNTPSPSPTPDRPPSALSSFPVPPARPRPRGESTASDLSQRISVAAFREAQARRSAANSPVPSALGDGLKADSPYLSARRSPSGQPPDRGRKRSSTVGSPPTLLDPSPISRLPPSRTPPTRSSTAPLFPSSDLSTSSEESESEESESEEEATLRPSRKRTITNKSSNRAQSELGHRSQPLSSPFTSPSPSSNPLNRPMDTLPASSSSFLEARPRPQAGLTKNGRTPSTYSRTRASVSTSALVPDASAKRASLIAQQSASALKNAPLNRPRVNSSASTSSESSSSGSSDDLPLAAFALPQRPNSSASSASRIPPKPLIDISTLSGVTKPPPLQTLDSPQPSPSARQPPSAALTVKVDDSRRRDASRPRKTSLGLAERLTQLTTGSKGQGTSVSSSDSQSPELPYLRAKSPNLKVDTSRPPPTSFVTARDPESPPIVPTPIRERPAAPAFAVTSRPTSHASSASIGTITAMEQATAKKETERPDPTTVRMVRPSTSSSPREPSLPRPSPKPSSSASRGPTTTLITQSSHNELTSSGLPPKPFSGFLRDNSPASSTGDSSSGRMPVTPRDGSELGAPTRSANRGAPSSAYRDTKSEIGAPTNRHRKRASVSFLDERQDEREGRERERERKKMSAVASEDDVRGRDRAEEKRKERRRGEAKAAIELGNVVNGKGPLADDDDEEMPSRMGMNMLGANSGNNLPFPTGSFQGQWGSSGSASAPPGPYSNSMPNMSMSNMNLSMGMDMNMMNMNPGAIDPRMLAAHQQAMIIAKQTYQYAVAQQAMRDAADEWERGSTVSGWAGGGGRSSVAASVMGMPNIPPLGMGGMNMGIFPPNGFGMGMGSGGSVIGSGGSVMGGGGGMGMGWPGGGMMFPPAPRSMYAGSVYAASEVGGGQGWGSRSAYGGEASTPRDRSSRAPRQSTAPPPVPPITQRSREGPRPRTKTAPSSGGQGAGQGAKGRGDGQTLVGHISPPSSWKGQS